MDTTHFILQRIYFDSLDVLKCLLFGLKCRLLVLTFLEMQRHGDDEGNADIAGQLHEERDSIRVVVH